MKQKMFYQKMLYSTLLFTSPLFLLNNNESVQASEKSETNLILGNEAKKNKFVKNADVEKVINLNDGIPYNFIARWYPSDGDADKDGVWEKKPSNIKIIDENDTIHPNKESDKKTVKINHSERASDGNVLNMITFLGFKGQSDKYTSTTGKFGVVYENVGYINGNQVDLEVTVNGYKPYANREDQRGISFSVESIGIATSGLSDVGLQYKLKFHDSNIEYKTPLNDFLKKTGWILTFADVDANQALRIYNNTFNGDNAPKALWSNPSSPLKYGNSDSDIEVKAQNGTNYAGNDVNQSFTAVFDKNSSNNSKIIHWLKDYKNKDKNGTNYWGTQMTKDDRVGGEYLGYSGIKPADSMLTTPDKKVYDYDEPLSENIDNTVNGLTEIYEPFNYQLSHYVPYESKKYKDYYIEDVLDENLKVDINSIKIYRKNAIGTLTPVDSYFDKKVEEITDSNGKKHDKIIISATKDTLNKNLYNKEFVFRFSVKRKYSNYLPSVIPQYKNVAKVYAHAENGQKLWLDNVIDGKSSNETNEVITSNPKKIEYNIEKFQKTQENPVFTKDILKTNVEQNVSYAIDYTIPNDIPDTIKTLTLKDSFSKYFISKDNNISIKVFDVSDWIPLPEIEKGDVIQNNTNINNFEYDVSISGKTLKSLIGKKIRIEKTGILSKDAINQTISNTAFLILNDKKINSNEVKILTPDKISSLRKYIKADKNSNPESDDTLEDVSPTQKPMFEIETTVPNNVNSQQKLIFNDTFDKNLDILNGKESQYIKVYNNNSWEDLKLESPSDLKWDIKDTSNGKNVSIILTGKTLEKLQNKKIKYCQEVKLKPNTIKPKIENVASVKLDSTTLNSNKVYLLPSGIKGKVDKFIWDGKDFTKAKQTGYEEGQTVKYKINYTIPTNKEFEKIKIVDDLNENLDLENAEILLNDKPFTDENSKLSLNKDKETVEWDSNTNNTSNNEDYERYAGKTLTLKIEAKVKKQAISNKENVIPNNSYFILDNNSNTKTESNTVELTTLKEIEPNIKKYIIKNNEKLENLDNVQCGEKVEYLLDIQVPKGKAYDTVSVKDDLDNFIDLKEVSVFDENNKNITDTGKLNTNNTEESFIWETKNIDNLKGKNIKVKIKGNLKYSPLIKDKTKINNIATLNIDNQEIHSNNVVFNTKIIESTAEKWIKE